MGGGNFELIGDFFGKGYFGVDVFFFLSTYGLSYSINERPLLQFYKNRFSRILPVYLVFLLLCLLVFIPVSWKSSIMYAVSSITGIAVVNGYYVEWYTPSLMLVYLFFPCINYFSKKLAIVNVNILALCFMLFYTLLYYFDVHQYGNLFQRIPIIMFGCICFYLEKRDDNSMVILLSLLGLFGVFFSYGCFDRVTLAIPAILYVAGKAERLPLHSWMSTLGKWSFEIYLAQVIATKYFMKVYNGVFQILYVFLITIVLSLLFSCVSCYFRRLIIEPVKQNK